MYLPSPAWKAGMTEEEPKEYGRHRYFYGKSPAWYNPTIQIKGRRYVIPWHGQGYWGEVVVDDIKHVVFIHTSYS
jgi:hypothetical protein